MICTQDELASVFGVSVPTIQAWQAAGMPYKKAEKRGKANQYDTAKCITWKIGVEAAKAEEGTAKARLETLKVAREELALRREIGETVSIEIIVPLLDRYVSDVSNIIDGLPEKYAVIIQQARDPAAQHTALQRFAREVRDALADFDIAALAAGAGGADSRSERAHAGEGVRAISAAA